MAEKQLKNITNIPSHEQMQNKTSFGDYRDGSLVKSTYWSCRGPQFPRLPIESMGTRTHMHVLTRIHTYTRILKK